MFPGPALEFPRMGVRQLLALPAPPAHTVHWSQTLSHGRGQGGHVLLVWHPQGLAPDGGPLGSKEEAGPRGSEAALSSPSPLGALPVQPQPPPGCKPLDPENLWVEAGVGFGGCEA